MEEKETGRLEAFSDGVFAVAITLLVLNLHLPDALKDDNFLRGELFAQWPAFAAFVTSFVPFPTALLAEYTVQLNQHLAAFLYCGTLLVLAICFNLLWRYAAYKNRLLDKKADPEAVQAITRQYRFGPLFYLIAFGLAWVYVPASLRPLCLILVLSRESECPIDIKLRISSTVPEHPGPAPGYPQGVSLPYHSLLAALAVSNGDCKRVT